MSRKRHTLEQIIGKLREAKVGSASNSMAPIRRSRHTTIDVSELTPVDRGCISIGVQSGVQWLVDNWLIVLGVGAGIAAVVVAAIALKRGSTEDVSIKRVFLTHAADELRVETVNDGTIDVHIRSVGVYMPDEDEKGFMLFRDGNDDLMRPGAYRVYGRRVDEILGFTKGKLGAQVSVRSDKQELARSNVGEVDSLLTKAQAALSE